MSAVWFRARSDLRRSWRSWVGLGLLVGLIGGAVIAAAAGARRTDSAYARFVASSSGRRRRLLERHRSDLRPDPSLSGSLGQVDPGAPDTNRSSPRVDGSWRLVKAWEGVRR